MLTILQNKKLNWLWSFSLFGIILITSILINSFNRGLYHSTYTKLKTAESMNITQSELDTATSVLLDYIVDNRDDLHVTLENGESFFNQREIDHMVDVKNLYNKATYILYGCMVVFIIFSIAFLFGPTRFLMRQSFKTGFIVFAGIMLFIAGFAMIDFQDFWIKFHELVFTNDLWLLNPNTDRLINMVPLSFFNQLVFRIIFTILVSLIILWFVIYYEKSKKVNNQHLNIVLFEPEIPQNTGNIMRTAMATGATLHLIEPLGFIWDEKRVRRSGMDYIDQLDIRFYPSIQDFLSKIDGTCVFVTRYGQRTHDSIDYTKLDKDIYLVFGKESTGLPFDILKNDKEHCVRIPMVEEARSLNLSNSVAIVIYEAARQLGYPNLSIFESIKGFDWIDKHQ